MTTSRCTPFLLVCVFFITTLCPASAALIVGRVQLGSDALFGLSGKIVILYEATREQPIVRGFAKTGRNGEFVLGSFVDSTEGIFYLQAYVGLERGQ